MIGIDYNSDVIEYAKNKYQKSNLHFHSGEALDFLNNSKEKFNVLILSHILEHLDDPGSFLKRFKDSFEFIYIELPDFEKNYLNIYRKDLSLNLIYTDDDHVSEFDRDELKSLLLDCGIEIVKEEYRYGVIKIWCKSNKSPIDS